MSCKTCGAPGPFYASNKATCVECVKARTRAHRAANLDSARQYDRARAPLPHRRKNAQRVLALWRKSNPERRAAHIAVGNAVRNGRLVPLPCFVCGMLAEAHHPDYSAPLAVSWLCKLHHEQTHAEHDARKGVVT